MKKIVLTFSFILIVSVTFAQNKPKDMKVLRDSVFTVMKLSKVNRQKKRSFGVTVVGLQQFVCPCARPQNRHLARLLVCPKALPH